eukprot:maker-scaffold_22-snap-gene-4.11-mRNA-1 protein AED:0.14 eAED:0.38 QI:0/0/0/1/1/1/2/0/435
MCITKQKSEKEALIAKDVRKPNQITPSLTNLRFIYFIGFFLAVLLYLTLDINIHTRSTVSSDSALVLELKVHKPRAFEQFDTLLQKYKYAEGDVDEEHLLTDTLTEIILDGEVEDSDPSEVSETVWKRVQDYKGPIRVALYTGPGTTMNARNNVPYVLNHCSDGNIRVTSITDGSLDGVGRLYYDVIFVPGGSAGRIFSEMVTQSRKKKKLGPAQKIRKFLSKGGGYVGICAGAYLAAGGKSGKSPFKISMYKTESGMLGDGFISYSEVDKDFSMTESFNQAQVPQNITKLFYANGPIFSDQTLDPEKVNKQFKNEFQDVGVSNPEAVIRIGETEDTYMRIFYGGPKKMRGSNPHTHKRHKGMPIVVTNDFGMGKVVLSTAHPETNVQDSTFEHWNKAREPARCDSSEAKILMSMVYLSARRGPEQVDQEYVYKG